ncbi:MAG TPA: hypothetical protein VH062_24670 [Polyangiaceae bacterium]|nr:hypothetical protein [Polyangiaceae bacterium]
MQKALARIRRAGVIESDFGPYADVLKGLTYVSDGRGLIPHEEVTAWLERQATALARGPFRATKPG